MSLLRDKVALVTGAARGIGRAIAEAFAEEGAQVAVADVLEGEAMAVAENIRAGCGVPAVGLGLDVSSPAAVRDAIAGVVREFGHIDILVNNAGILRAHLITDFPYEEWQSTFEINVHGTFLCSQAAAREMIRQGTQGCIINIASASGKKADRFEAAYCASKAAVIAFTRVLALELGPYGIRANAILPGATDTEMLRSALNVPGLKEELLARTPLGRIATPRDQAHAAVFLASGLASHVTGAQLVVSGGEFMDT